MVAVAPTHFDRGYMGLKFAIPVGGKDAGLRELVEEKSGL
jgi:hypothetical protein